MASHKEPTDSPASPASSDATVTSDRSKEEGVYFGNEDPNVFENPSPASPASSSDCSMEDPFHFRTEPSQFQELIAETSQPTAGYPSEDGVCSFTKETKNCKRRLASNLRIRLRKRTPKLKASHSFSVCFSNCCIHTAGDHRCRTVWEAGQQQFTLSSLSVFIDRHLNAVLIRF